MLKRRVLAVVILVLGLAGVVKALQDAPARRERELAPRYKVTPWPADSAERSFAEHVERHLNEMAEQGWEFDSALSGQPSRLMIFRRP